MADVAEGRSPRATGEPSTAELLHRATEQLSRLVRDELALARAELTEKGRHAGIGVGLFGGGGALALYGLGALLVALVLLLAQVMPAWIAAAIVAVVLFAAAAGLALSGRRQIRRSAPPVPTAAVDGVRTDVGAVTSAVRDRGRR